MKLLLTLRTAVRRTTAGLAFGGMFAVLPLMVLTSTEVVGRAVWSRPVPGSMELSSYLLAIFLLLGIAYTYQTKGHVRVDMFLSLLPPRVVAGLDVVTTALGLAMALVIAWQGWVVAIDERAVSDMLRVPQWPFRMLVSVAGVTLALELLIDLCEAAARLVRR
ncbi:MAG: TRAP transporter small permease subunit [Deferrisomatales bacterium]